jgi:phage shock protein PspC (stress-responsive transcriptional regulator)
MEASNVSSQEKLDQMLRNGSVTRADYLRLVKAIDGVPNPPDPEAASPLSQPRRLRRSYEGRELGGVCAGYAQYLGIKKESVRVSVVIAFFLLNVLGGMGYLLIPLYLALCAILPWGDDDEKTKTLAQGHHTRVFMAGVAFLFFFLPTFYAIWGLPQVEQIYAGLGQTGSHPFQGTLSGAALHCAGLYRRWSTLVWPILNAAIFAGFLGLIYSVLASAQHRKYYAYGILGLGTAWIFFLVIGSLYPALTMIEIRR